MVATADDSAPGGDVAGKLEIAPGMLVQEVGWDSDCEEFISIAIEEALGEELLDEDTDEVVDRVLLWWRDGDGDLVDALMDVIVSLSDDGSVWVLTPKAGRDGAVEPAEIAESALTAGFKQTSSVPLGGWLAARLVQPKGPRGRR